LRTGKSTYGARVPVNNREYWVQKVARNRERDRKTLRTLRARCAYPIPYYVSQLRIPWVRKGKFNFAPNDDCDRRAKQLIRLVEKSVDLPDCFYHYRKGGHVAALHRHIENRYFFKIDIRNFFYSISRNRIASVLHRVGFPYARTNAAFPTGERRPRRCRAPDDLVRAGVSRIVVVDCTALEMRLHPFQPVAACSLRSCFLLIF
jgi:hypothetical protein